MGMARTAGNVASMSLLLHTSRYEDQIRQQCRLFCPSTTKSQDHMDYKTPTFAESAKSIIIKLH